MDILGREMSISKDLGLGRSKIGLSGHQCKNVLEDMGPGVPLWSSSNVSCIWVEFGYPIGKKGILEVFEWGILMTILG